MILYFSATGNSKYTAEKIGKALDDTASSITTIKEKTLEVNDDYFGIVIPTCFWTASLIVREFLDNINLKINKKTYVFFVITYGSFTGSNGRDLEKKLNKKNILVDSKYSVKMPDTWTPIFDLTDSNKNNELLKNADKRIDYIIEKIKLKEKGNFVQNRFPGIITLLCKPMYNMYRKTKNFKVNDNCIGCGLCEKKCPCNAIKIVNNKPVWVKEECTLCLGCMHRCPKFAIEYRKVAKKHGQYVNPNTKL